MAEALFKKMLADIGEEGSDIEVMSAGTGAIEGQQASPQAVSAMAEEGLDLSQHRSKQITAEMIEEADLVLTMTRRHKESIISMVPAAKDKVFTLKEFAYKEGIDDYEKRMQEINERIREKQKAFEERNRGKLEDLIKRREKLKKELDEIEGKIKQLNKTLEEETCEERRELMKLEYVIDDLDISDPFGQPVDVYRKSAKEIKKALKEVLEKIKKGQ